ncbi:MAG: DUF1816 domain-containing protein [Chroococcales cyanobacterium]
MIETFLNISDDLVLSCVDRIGLAWWIQVVTESPSCIYYFGPFTSAKLAHKHLFGYLEDLEQEEANIVSVDIKQTQPKVFTVEGESVEAFND